MHHYKSVLLLQITICNDTDGEHNNEVTIQSCSGAWVWLIIILVIISCTDLSSLYILHQFSNFIQLVPVLFAPVQLFTFLIFGGKFLCLVSLFSGLILHYNWLLLLYQCCLFMVRCFLWNSNLYYTAATSNRVRTVSWMPLLSKKGRHGAWMTWTEDHITCSPRLTVSWMPLLSKRQTWSLNDLNWGPHHM